MMINAIIKYILKIINNNNYNPYLILPYVIQLKERKKNNILEAKRTGKVIYEMKIDYHKMWEDMKPKIKNLSKKQQNEIRDIILND